MADLGLIMLHLVNAIGTMLMTFAQLAKSRMPPTRPAQYTAPNLQRVFSPTELSWR
jgi:hypothetical protein